MLARCIAIATLVVAATTTMFNGTALASTHATPSSITIHLVDPCADGITSMCDCTNGVCNAPLPYDKRPLQPPRPSSIPLPEPSP
jgi:hypothetical protein